MKDDSSFIFVGRRVDVGIASALRYPICSLGFLMHCVGVRRYIYTKI